MRLAALPRISFGVAIVRLLMWGEVTRRPPIKETPTVIRCSGNPAKSMRPGAVCPRRIIPYTEELARRDIVLERLGFAHGLGDEFFTTSPIETMPATRPFSITGMWRKRQRVMVSMISAMVSFSSQVATSLVMRSATVSTRPGAPSSAIARTMSRSEIMPLSGPSVADQERADAVEREHSGGLEQRRLRRDRQNVPALFPQDMGHKHGPSLR